jgi:hypothetical protein
MAANYNKIPRDPNSWQKKAPVSTGAFLPDHQESGNLT